MGSAPLDTPDNMHTNPITPGILCECYTMKDEAGNDAQSPEHIITALLPSVPAVGSKLAVPTNNEIVVFAVCDVVFTANGPSVQVLLQRVKHFSNFIM